MLAASDELFEVGRVARVLHQRVAIGQQDEVEVESLQARVCMAATVVPWPVTPMKRTSPSHGPGWPPPAPCAGPSAISHSAGSTRLWSWMRST